jgi:hypothetical protein
VILLKSGAIVAGGRKRALFARSTGTMLAGRRWLDVISRRKMYASLSSATVSLIRFCMHVVRTKHAKGRSEYLYESKCIELVSSSAGLVITACRALLSTRF